MFLTGGILAGSAGAFSDHLGIILSDLAPFVGRRDVFGASVGQADHCGPAHVGGAATALLGDFDEAELDYLVH
jgi:hypothetical protein